MREKAIPKQKGPLFSTPWDLSPFFGTLRLIFSEIFLLFLPSIFDILQQNGCSKIPKRPPFTLFGTMRLTGNFKKISKKNRNFFSQFLVFWELLLSPVVEKVVFVFESFWALDMAPTWAVPGLFPPDLPMKTWNFSKTVDTIIINFCTVIVHPKVFLCAEWHQNRMTGIWEP